MAKTRAGATKTAKKTAAKKTAAKKPAAKAPAKKAAKAPAKKVAAKKVAPKVAPKAAASRAAAPKKKAPAAASRPTRSEAKAEPRPAPKRPSVKPPPKPAVDSPPIRDERIADQATIAERTAEIVAPTVVRARKDGGEPIGAHPDSQLTSEELEILHEKLMVERERVVAGFDRHLQEALGENEVMPDETDMAQRSTEQAYLIRFADKERKLLSEIEHALEKMRNGEYGVCEGTEEAIGFKRLELRPWTRYSVAYKEQMERDRSQHRR